MNKVENIFFELSFVCGLLGFAKGVQNLMLYNQKQIRIPKCVSLSSNNNCNNNSNKPPIIIKIKRDDDQKKSGLS